MQCTGSATCTASLYDPGKLGEGEGRTCTTAVFGYTHSNSSVQVEHYCKELQERGCENVEVEKLQRLPLQLNE